MGVAYSSMRLLASSAVRMHCSACWRFKLNHMHHTSDYVHWHGVALRSGGGYGGRGGRDYDRPRYNDRGPMSGGGGYGGDRYFLVLFDGQCICCETRFLGCVYVKMRSSYLWLFESEAWSKSSHTTILVPRSLMLLWNDPTLQRDVGRICWKKSLFSFYSCTYCPDTKMLLYWCVKSCPRCFARADVHKGNSHCSSKTWLYHGSNSSISVGYSGSHGAHGLGSSGYSGAYGGANSVYSGAHGDATGGYSVAFGGATGGYSGAGYHRCDGSCKHEDALLYFWRRWKCECDRGTWLRFFVGCWNLFRVYVPSMWSFTNNLCSNLCFTDACFLLWCTGTEAAAAATEAAAAEDMAAVTATGVWLGCGRVFVWDSFMFQFCSWSLLKFEIHVRVEVVVQYSRARQLTNHSCMHACFVKLRIPRMEGKAGTQQLRICQIIGLYRLIVNTLINNLKHLEMAGTVARLEPVNRDMIDSRTLILEHLS